MRVTAREDLISAWRTVDVGSPPFRLEADAAILDEHCTIVTYGNDEYLSERFIFSYDSRLHLGLIPEPYSGKLSSAKIFILMLNPGLGPGDYYAQATSPEWRDLLGRNLHRSWASPFWINGLPGRPVTGWRSSAASSRN
jgi:hypothetical protein